METDSIKNNGEPWKVHLMGGDQIGWALDQDLATTRSALSELDDILKLTNLEEADVVHSVWEEPLLALEPRVLQNKRVVCHVCNDVFKTFGNSFMIDSMDRIGLWVAISQKAERDLRSIGLKTTYMPYTLDPSDFPPRLPADTARTLRTQHSLPEGKYIIGNFMRDTLGADLSIPKEQKGADVFLQIVVSLFEQRLPIHVLLAGPRRHWLRKNLQQRGISYTYIGEETNEDDNDINILSQTEMGKLYHLIDVNLVTSRWEGGPRCVLEGVATKTKVVSSNVGLAPDALESTCIYQDLDGAVDILASDIKGGSLNATVESQYKRYVDCFNPACNIPKLREIYKSIDNIPIWQNKNPESSDASRYKRTVRKVSKAIRHYRHGGQRGGGIHVGLWHEFHKPPYGGGNQFMMALQKSLKKLNAKVSVNSISPFIDVHICNSAWFDTNKLSKISKRRKPKVIHRVDGPIALYRQSNWNEDEKIYRLNEEWASATVYQSAWCFQKLLQLNFNPVRPVIIHNGVDSSIFHSNGRDLFAGNRKVRLISTAWSDNPKKGGPFYKQLEERLDWDRFEYTFVGRTKEKFDKIKHIPAQDSVNLANILRQHDIYVMASESEACSNALLEALACGLPSLYLDDGGNGELVGFGGLPFRTLEEALSNLDVIVERYGNFQGVIWVNGMEVVAQRYLDIAEQLMHN